MAPIGVFEGPGPLAPHFLGLCCLEWTYRCITLGRRVVTTSQAFLHWSISEWRRRLENVAQCNSGHIQHVCLPYIGLSKNQRCLCFGLEVVLHFHRAGFTLNRALFRKKCGGPSAPNTTIGLLIIILAQEICFCFCCVTMQAFVFLVLMWGPHFCGGPCSAEHAEHA